MARKKNRKRKRNDGGLSGKEIAVIIAIPVVTSVALVTLAAIAVNRAMRNAQIIVPPPTEPSVIV